jgi:hypothetical protein
MQPLRAATSSSRLTQYNNSSPLSGHHSLPATCNLQRFHSWQFAHCMGMFVRAAAAIGAADQLALLFQLLKMHLVLAVLLLLLCCSCSPLVCWPLSLPKMPLAAAGERRLAAGAHCTCITTHGTGLEWELGLQADTTAALCWLDQQGSSSSRSSSSSSSSSSQHD